MNNYKFRLAVDSDAATIWGILETAIIRRKLDGSEQWQDGYPNPEVIANDIDKSAGYVLTQDDAIIGYAAVFVNDEPAYDSIEEGKWLTNGDFVVIHRIAVAEGHLGKGLSGIILKYIKRLALEKNIYSIKVDTNFDNLAMMKIFEKSGYQYCGKVFLRGKPRRAYEKVIKN